METVLRTHRLSKKYGDKLAVNNVSMTIEKGQIKESKGGYYSIRMKTQFRDIDNLALAINDIYEINQRTSARLKLREEELRRSIANLSHDLRTPLTSIMGYMQLIKDIDLDDETRHNYMAVIYHYILP